MVQTSFSKTLTPIKIMTVVFSLLVAWASLSLSLVQVTRASNFDFAMTLSSNDPVALSKKADYLLSKGTTDPTRLKRIATLADRSLVAQALNASALRALLFANAANRERGWQVQAAQLSNRATRRDLGSNLWFIEDNVARDNIAGALSHYDLALRTSAESGPVLHPLLTSALEEASIRAALVPFIVKNPPWMSGFLWHAVGNSPSPSLIADLLVKAKGSVGRSVTGDIEKALLAKLVSTGQSKQAQSFYTQFKDADLSLVTSPQLTKASTSGMHSVMGWQSLGTSSANVNFSSAAGDAKPSMDIYAAPGDRQVVGRKLLFLGAGTHSFSAQFGRIDLPAGASVTWRLSCTTAQAQLVIWASDAVTPSSNDSFKAMLAVPANCHAQYLDVEIAGGQTQQGAEVQVIGIEVKSAS